MAPISIKRSPSLANLDEPDRKKMKRSTVRHHKLAWDSQRQQRQDEVWQDEASLQSMLARSVALALEAVGFEAAEPGALSALCSDAEEYMAHFLANVRHCMLASRRPKPIPEDILQSLHSHQLSLRSLLPHLDPPVPPFKSQFTLEAETTQPNEQEHFRFLGPDLISAPEEKARSYVPKHFPDYPSKHTYRSTSEFPEREIDPRQVRERATEEGRLGEEALRRLVGAGSKRSNPDDSQRLQDRSMRAKRDKLWMETMQAIAAEPSEKMDVDSGYGSFEKEKHKDIEISSSQMSNGLPGLAVNSEKKYWRKPISQKKVGNSGQ